MKYCEECGYRLKVEEDRCPLCGQRMKTIPDHVSPLQTHVHQEGEHCALPNTDQPRRTVTRPQTHVHTERGETCILPNKGTAHTTRRAGTSQRTGSKNQPQLAIIVIVILFVLLRACAG